LVIKLQEMKRSHFFILATMIFLMSFTKSAAQTNMSSFYSNYTFTADSLKGFEEGAAKNSAISEGYLGEEFSVRMFQLKRQYINAKYHLTSSQKNRFEFAYKLTSPPANCVNEDFESSTAAQITSQNQISGWTVDAGLNQFPHNSCNLSGCCPNNPSESQLISTGPFGFVDPVIGGNYPIYSVFGTTLNSGNAVNPSIPNMYGNNIIRINSQVNNYSIERLSKTINVTSANALFKFAFISVFSTGHTCCDAGAIQIKLTNLSTNSLIACPNLSLTAPGTQCTNTTNINYFNASTGTPFTGTGFIIYNKWNINSIDLTPYLGSNILIEIIATDCTASGHYGYGYFDASCGAQTFTVNGTNNGGGNYTICNPIFSYYTADSYLWNGPAGSGITNVTTPTINVTTSGIYTLQTTNNGCAGVSTQTLNLTLVPPPSVMITSTSPSICIGGSAILSTSVTGATSFSWSTGSGNPSIFVSPTITTVYSVTANYFGSCAQTNTFALAVNSCSTTQLKNNTISEKNILVFPNPVKDKLNVGTNGILIQEINISNSIGQIVFTAKYDNASNAVLDLQNLSNGIYFMKVSSNKGAVSKKIIVE